MKQYLSFFLLLTVLFATAQQAEEHDFDGKCSRILQFKQSMQAARSATFVQDTYHPHYLHIKMDVSSENINISGDVSTSALVSCPQLDTIYLELNSQLNIDQVQLNASDVAYTFNNSELFIVLDTAMQEGDSFTVRLRYHGNPGSSGSFFTGLSNAHNYYYDKNVTWSLSAPFTALDWLPMRQSLDYKIDSVYQEYTCAADNMVGSNGLLQQVIDNGNGTKTYCWKTHYPIAYYLISFAVADYQEYNVYAKPTQLDGDSILIQNFLYNTPSCLNANRAKMDKSAEIMELFSEKFSLYPFHEEKYGNCLTELSGGMEHQTMTTIGSFDFGLNAHEMSHQWFGDNITCATWSDIWINEGFATCAATIAREFLISPSAARNEMSGYQSQVLVQPGGSVYVPQEEVTYDNAWRIFNYRLTYAKGAAILHQLRYLVNDDNTFFSFLQHYSNEFRGKSATGAQFRDAMEDYTGLDLHPYFEQWYYGEGYPTYSIACEQAENGNAHFTVTHTSSSESTPLFTLPLEVKVEYASGASDTTFRIPISANTAHFDILLPQQVANIKIDPNKWLIKKVDDITLGIDNLQNELDLVLGPNPVRHQLQVAFKDNGKALQLDIYDLSGRKIEGYQCLYSPQYIDVSHLPAGGYLVKVRQGQKILSKKLLKL